MSTCHVHFMNVMFIYLYYIDTYVKHRLTNFIFVSRTSSPLIQQQNVHVNDICCEIAENWYAVVAKTSNTKAMWTLTLV